MLGVGLILNVSSHRRRDPDSYNNYYSDGICGVSFGIAEPEFANPLATCCEQHFFTAEELDRHTAEHVVCPGIPGMEGSSCGHSIHPSAIAFHLETEHATANSAADTKGDAEHNGPALKRWREARRRNYPTFERVQAKIREPQRANAKSRLNYPPALDNLELATNSGDVGRPTPFVEDVEGTPEVGIDLPTVRGNEDEESPSVPTPIPRPLVSYDSDVSWSEQLEEIEEIEPPASSSAKKTLLEQLETVQPKNAQEEDTHGDPQTTLSSNTSKERRIGRPKRDKRGRRRRERRDRARSDAEDENEPTTSTAADDGEVEIDEVSAKGGVKAFAAHPLVQMFARRRACMRHASLISKRPTLLQMLLAEEMRHERNQLMQCVRFVVKNNFFLSE
ncbi:Nuclear fragile X mental retardation-interacting protein [Echinococcus granulosus]|uniref:Nuclear fragile X mental retardation-interacting protein n=1 Tax=Echinococcus granulosus TaxID=6210 RepID=W6U467_ECHGR|nr:Nuclear fragile X mental retardation-interacting protein [Echinococcus granulosus]EUB55905.1 Nuclear fragile X mental retardation-interacting protein [Echinococcus granulosus]